MWLVARVHLGCCMTMWQAVWVYVERATYVERVICEWIDEMIANC
jgi:hypothetical protein